MKKIFRKSIALLLVCTALLLALASCTVEKAYPGAPEGMRPCNDGSEGVILYVPTSWSVDYSTGIPTAYFSSTDSTMINMVTVPKETLGQKTIGEYFSEYEESFKSTVKNFKLIPHTKEIPYEELENKNYGFKMYAYIYTFDVKKSASKSVSYKFSQTLFKTDEDSDLYIITYGTTADKFDIHFEDLGKVLAKIKPVSEPVSMGEDAPIKPVFSGKAPDGYSALTAEYVDYVLYVPNTWIPVVNTGITAASKADDATFTASVTAFKPQNDDNVFNDKDYISFFSSTEALLKDTFGENSLSFPDEENKFQKVEFRKQLGISEKYAKENKIDTNARKYAYSVNANGTSFSYEQYIVLKDGYFYILTLSCKTEAYDDAARAVFDGIASNFRFK